MKKGKSTYQFPICVDPNLAHQTIMNWLGANSFELKEKNGNYYYQYYDPVIGRRLFEFYIQPNMVTINAYIGKYKKPYLLDDSFYGTVPKTAYKQLLEPLFQTLNTYNTPGAGEALQTGDGGNSAAPYNVQPYASDAAGAQPVSGDYENYANAANKSNEKMAVIGFVMSIIGLLLAFVGLMYGIWLYALEFYFASRGIRSKKKGFAIATFVLGGLSVAILLVYAALFG
ncbi:MAG: hypothetical protein K2O34_13770 [Acetatifactor sp.]|nr:hypothetical protein [Acetatifactor sp.]